jgi:hypothetical protein
MIFVVTPDTIRRSDALSPRKVPARVMGRGMRAVPRAGPASRVFWRMVLDQSFPRYMLALVPFPVAMLIRPDLALAISQAPLLMFALVYLVEANVLSIPTPEKRRALMAEDRAERGLDRLRLRGREILSRIAAGRQMTEEVLHLVVEQSALARVPQLTLVSVQVEAEKPYLLALDPAEREMLAERLFDDDLSEQTLHLINLRENVFLRDVALEARAISAHARLMAMARP